MSKIVAIDTVSISINETNFVKLLVYQFTYRTRAIISHGLYFFTHFSLQLQLILQSGHYFLILLFQVELHFFFLTKFGFQRKKKKVSSTMYNALGMATKLSESKPYVMAVCMQPYSLVFLCCT